MTTARELSNLIHTLQARHRQGLAADMSKLRVKYGTPAVNEAQRLLAQHALRDALSVSADRHRRYVARQVDREAQELFKRK
jgi:hypothetical protein